MIKLAELLDEKATFTDEFDSDPRLKGGQKKLPDQLQKAILGKKKLKKENMQCEMCGGMHSSQDHEAQMAKGELRDMLTHGAKLYQMIQPGQNLPGWVSAYITLASDYIHSVAEYMTEESISGDE